MNISVTKSKRIRTKEVEVTHNVTRPFIRLFKTETNLNTITIVSNQIDNTEEALYVDLQENETVTLKGSGGEIVEILKRTNDYRIRHYNLFQSLPILEIFKESGFSNNHKSIFYTVGSVTAEFNNELYISSLPRRNAEINNFGKKDILTSGVGARTVSNRRALARRSVSVTPQYK